MRQFGVVLSQYLDELGISQSELARRMGTGRQTLNSIIKGGRRGPTLETAVAISEALGIPLDEMIARMKDDPAPD